VAITRGPDPARSATAGAGRSPSSTFRSIFAHSSEKLLYLLTIELKWKRDAYFRNGLCEYCLIRRSIAARSSTGGFGVAPAKNMSYSILS